MDDTDHRTTSAGQASAPDDAPASEPTGAPEPDRAPQPKHTSEPANGRMMDVPIAEMESATSRALRNAGASPEAAGLSARELVANELDGASDHGLQRVAELVDAMESGDLDPEAEPRVERTGARSWRVNGRGCLPRDVAAEAARALIEGAGTDGLASVAVCSNNSLGRLASIAAPVAEEGLLVLGFARSRRDADKVVAHGGRRGKLGSNPMVFAAPAGEPGADHGPVVVDVATSAASAGEVRSRVARGEPVPEGWLIDRDGNPVHRGDGLDAEPPEAFLLPLGGRSQGHKGFGLALMVEILAGVLTGSRLNGSMQGGSMQNGSNGHGANGSANGSATEGEDLEECALFIALSPRLAGRDEAAVRRDVESLARYLEDSGEGNRVEIPGWRARELRRGRLVDGSMALPTSLWTSVLRLAEPHAESEDLGDSPTVPPATLTTARVVASRRGRQRRPLVKPRSEVAAPQPPGGAPRIPPQIPPQIQPQD